MSAPLFLVDALPDGDEFRLNGPEGHHAATVQRLRAGEPVMLGDGRGNTAQAVVTAVGRASLDVRIGKRVHEQPADPRLVVVQGIAKGDRGELAVQAMTEVGVDVIVPWSASRSVVRWHGERGERTRQRWVNAARAAAKQARRAWLPDITTAESIRSVSRRLAGAACALVLHEEATTSLTTVDLPRTGEIVLAIGPEGGVSPDELEVLEAAGASAVRLGETVLRTSTAGVAALVALSVRLGRW